MNPCPNAASWNDGDGEADRPIPTPKRGLSGPAFSGGQGQVELGRASGLVVGGLHIPEAEVFEDFPRGQAVLDDGNDLAAAPALSAFEVMMLYSEGVMHLTVSRWRSVTPAPVMVTNSRPGVSPGLFEGRPRAEA